MIVWTEKAEKHWQKRYGKKNKKKAWNEAIFCYEPIEFSTHGFSLYQCFLERGWIFNLTTPPISIENKKMRWKFIQAKLRQGYDKYDICQMLGRKTSTIESWVYEHKELSQELGVIKWKTKKQN